MSPRPGSLLCSILLAIAWLVPLALATTAPDPGGPDGVSGPDSAPNNLGGHPADYLIPVTIDSFAVLPADGDLDGLADMGEANSDLLRQGHEYTVRDREVGGQANQDFDQITTRLTAEAVDPPAALWAQRSGTMCEEHAHLGGRQ